jgi:hypothetical protein
MTLLSSGGVGIGTTSPYARLSVSSVTAASTTLALQPVSAQTGNIIDIFNSSGVLTTVMDANGNFAIGSSTPGSLFGIQGVANFRTGTSTIYSGLSVPTLAVTSATASSTFAGGIVTNGGINVTNGGLRLQGIISCNGTNALSTDANGVVSCDADDGGGGSISGSGVAGQITYWNSSSGVTGENSLTWNSSNKQLGVGTTSPWATLSVAANPTTVTNVPLFVISSSTTANAATSTLLIVDQRGRMGLGGTTTPAAMFSIMTQANDTPSPTRPLVPIFMVSTSTDGFGVGAVATGTAFLIDGRGKVGIGTTSPYSALSVSGTIGADRLSVGQGIGSSTFAGGVSTAGLSSSNGLTVTGGNLIFTGNNVGIGTTSPWGKFAIDAGVTTQGNVVNAVGSINSFLQYNIQNSSTGSLAESGYSATADTGNDITNFAWMGINNSNFSNRQTYTVGGPLDVNFLGTGNDMYIANGNLTRSILMYTGGTAYQNERFRITADGRIGIGGTTTPWGILSVVGTTTPSDNGAGTSTPLFVVATSSGAFPALFVTSTTTGKFDYARVAIGTTSTFSAANGTPSAGLRDQFTVAGRIYSTWRYQSCEFPQQTTAIVVTTALVNPQKLQANTLNVCQGALQFVEDTDGEFYPGTSTVPYLRLMAGSPASAGAGEGASFRSFNDIGAAANNIVMESWVRTSIIAGSSGVHVVGLVASSTAAGMDLGNDNTFVNGVYFTASTTGGANWFAQVKNSTGGVQKATNVPVSANAAMNSAFQKLRIELTPTEATFLIDGKVVAVIGTNAAGVSVVPTVALSPILSVGIATGGAGTYQPALDMSLYRLWMDDPPGGAVEVAQGGAVSPIESSTASSYSENYEEGSAFGRWYRREIESVSVPAGSLVSLSDQTSFTAVTPAAKPYGKLIGAVTESPYALIGGLTGDTPVASDGRVNVMVNLSNGPIKKGDRITSSESAGVGMKARRPGYIVGHALADFDPTNGQGICDATLLSTSTPFDQIATSTLVGSNCVAKVPVAVDLSFDMGISNIIGDAGDMAVDVFSAASELASDAFSEGQALVKVVTGKLVAQVGIIGNLFTSKLSFTPGGSINVPAGVEQMSGKGVIKLGQNAVFIAHTKVASSTKIFITPTVLTDVPLVLAEKQNGVGFKVSMAKNASADITFDWLLVQSYGDDPEQGTPAGSIQGATGGETPPPAPAPAPAPGGGDTPPPAPAPDDGGNASSTPPTGDTEAPIITVTGNNPATVTVGDSYSDLGASVTDNVSLNIGIVTTGDQIDTGTPGTHTVTYTAQDQAGNIGTATRTVNVVPLQNSGDTPPPAIEPPPPPDSGNGSSTPDGGN